MLWIRNPSSLTSSFLLSLEGSLLTRRSTGDAVHVGFYTKGRQRAPLTLRWAARRKYKEDPMNAISGDNLLPIQFGDDDSYLSWAEANPTHFVLTSNKSLTPQHTVIHRADCRLITRLTGSARPGGFTRSYIKVGGNNPSQLHDWAKRRRSDAETRECTVCARCKTLQ